MSSPGNSGPSVLCVDDESSILRLLVNVLSYSDYRPLVAQSAERALHILDSVSVDAVVIDYQMPLMDGLALAQKIVRRDAGMPIVVFTAFPEGLPRELRKLAFKIVDKGSPLINLTSALQDAAAARIRERGLREHLRFRVELPATVTTGGDGWAKRFQIQANSLGEGGFGAELPVTLAEGASVQLQLKLSDRELKVPASLRYIKGPVHGFQFLNISPEERIAIREYCETLL